MTSFVFFIVTTFKIWARHVMCVDKLSKTFTAPDAPLNFSLIPALIQELLKVKASPPGRMGLSWSREAQQSLHIIEWGVYEVSTKVRMI